jgi:N,N'-diacetyllegionaminate synthase
MQRKDSIDIVAEIGWNHMGDMTLAKEMVAEAAACGADIVKFQTWSVNRLKPGPWDTDGRREIYLKAQLSEHDHFELLNYCKQLGVQFMTSVFDVTDIPLVKSVSQKYIKIPSTECTNIELLDAVNGNFENALISTGASSWEEIKAINKRINKSTITLLHCVSSYPCLPENINLPRIKELFSLTPNVGYSGHLQGVDDAIAAIAFGCNVIEKHFTINNDLPGRDNKFALLPAELKKICDFRDAFLLMNLNHGLDLQSIEAEAKELYRGRWSG